MNVFRFVLSFVLYTKAWKKKIVSFVFVGWQQKLIFVLGQSHLAWSVKDRAKKTKS